jgi:hypothetical protein
VLSHRHVQLSRSSFSLRYTGESSGVSSSQLSAQRRLIHRFIFVSERCTQLMGFHTFTQARPTQQSSFSCVTQENHLRVSSQLSAHPSHGLPSPLTGAHNIPSLSQRGTTHPTHGIPHPTQGHTTFLLRLREEPHTHLMGTPNSWAFSQASHSVCVLEDVSRNCNHQHSLSAREAFSIRPSLSRKYSNFVLAVIINTPSQLGR